MHPGACCSARTESGVRNETGPPGRRYLHRRPALLDCADTECTMAESPSESAQSSDLLFAAVYERLKLMAGRSLASGARSVTLDTTVLVHELYLRINAQGDLAFSHPGQFFTYAARAMRHLLIDRARARASQRAA